MSVQKVEKKRDLTKQVRANKLEMALFSALAQFETGGNFSSLVRELCIARAQELPCKLADNERPERKRKLQQVKAALNDLQQAEAAH